MEKKGRRVKGLCICICMRSVRLLRDVGEGGGEDYPALPLHGVCAPYLWSACHPLACTGPTYLPLPAPPAHPQLNDQEKALKGFSCGLCKKTLQNPIITPCGTPSGHHTES